MEDKVENKMNCPHHEHIAERCGQIERLWITVDTKVGTKTLLSIVAITVTVLGVIVGILHFGYASTITRLEGFNVSITNQINKQDQVTNDTLKRIEVNMAVIQRDIEKMEKINDKSLKR